jgi:hypothetical protein
MKQITPVAGSGKSFNNATILIVGRQYKKYHMKGTVLAHVVFRVFYTTVVKAYFLYLWHYLLMVCFCLFNQRIFNGKCIV